jgi:glycosyltransferase involved in cell wall biosynthesis
VHQIKDFPDFGGDLQTSGVAPIARAVKSLPRPIRDGVLKLTDHFIATRPDIACLWQDGIVYDSGLAALLANVPRIILNVRSVPPIDRPDRNRPEYRTVFRSMLAADNVSLCVNSRYAAERYAEWLDVDAGGITVIRNGVAAQPPEGDAASERMFRRFEAVTGNASLTLGTVMRMDRNKRPLLWVEVAAKLLKERPGARFILVGDGLLRNHAMSRVAALGIADRFLFVGLSAHVGFWLSKMDLFLLTSAYEGLPNALVEAQLAGVPVITTAAGGAVEAIIPDITGLTTDVTSSASEIVSPILTLADDVQCRRQMGEAAAKWAREAFSPSRMLNETIQLFDSRGTRLVH